MHITLLKYKSMFIILRLIELYQQMHEPYRPNTIEAYSFNINGDINKVYNVPLEDIINYVKQKGFNIEANVIALRSYTID